MCACRFVNTCMCVYVCTHVSIYVCLCMSMHTCTHTCVCTHECVQMCVCMYAYAPACSHLSLHLAAVWYLWEMCHQEQPESGASREQERTRGGPGSKKPGWGTEGFPWLLVSQPAGPKGSTLLLGLRTRTTDGLGFSRWRCREHHPSVQSLTRVPPATTPGLKMHFLWQNGWQMSGSPPSPESRMLFRHLLRGPGAFSLLRLFLIAHCLGWHPHLPPLPSNCSARSNWYLTRCGVNWLVNVHERMWS